MRLVKESSYLLKCKDKNSLNQENFIRWYGANYNKEYSSDDYWVVSNIIDYHIIENPDGSLICIHRDNCNKVIYGIWFYLNNIKVRLVPSTR